MRGKSLSKTELEKYMGFISTNIYRTSEHCKKAALKATVLNHLKNFHYQNKQLGVCWTVQNIRSTAWSPWVAGNISLIDKVQEKALHLVYSLKRTTNQERCQEIELETLEEWRSSQDMTQTFKILNGVDSIN
jgi:hypothetical protein